MMQSALKIPQTQMPQSSILTVPDPRSLFLFFFKLYSLLSLCAIVIQRSEVKVTHWGRSIREREKRPTIILLSLRPAMNYVESHGVYSPFY